MNDIELREREGGSEGAREVGREEARERGSEGAMGSEGARSERGSERGSEGAREEARSIARRPLITTATAASLATPTTHGRGFCGSGHTGLRGGLKWDPNLKWDA